MSLEPEFYVYVLKDPRDDSIFYVGKGKKKRAWQHLKPTVRDNQRKRARIDEIREAGHAVVVEIVHRYDNEVDAYEHERELIALCDNLTNILDGHTMRLTREEAQRRSDERKAAEKEKDKLKLIEHMRQVIGVWNALEQVGCKFTCPGLPGGEKLAYDIIEASRNLLKECGVEPYQMVAVSHGPKQVSQ